MKNLFAAALFVCFAASSAMAQNKVGTINIQQAIISTKDGQKAAAELQTRFDPKRKEIERKQAEIQNLNAQLQKLGTVGSEEAKRKLQIEIESKQKSLQRDGEDAEADFNQEQQKILGEIGNRIFQVIGKYATDNGYSMILDIGSQQTPVIWATNTVDITTEVIKLYDANSPTTIAPVKPAGGAAAPAATPKSATPPAPTKTPATPAKK